MSEFTPVCRGDYLPEGPKTKTVAVTAEEAQAIRLALIYFADNPIHTGRLLEDGVDVRELGRKFK